MFTRAEKNRDPRNQRPGSRGPAPCAVTIVTYYPPRLLLSLVEITNAITASLHSAKPSRNMIMRQMSIQSISRKLIDAWVVTVGLPEDRS